MEPLGNVVPRQWLGKAGACAVTGALLLATAAPAQTISTIAGNAINDGRPATETTLVKPQGLALDASGNLLIADRGNFVVRRVAAATGVSTVLAGGGAVFDDAIPVPGRTAALDYPLFLAVDDTGNIYFSDYNHHRIRKITRDGLVTTIAGTGSPGNSGDGGKATLAELDTPAGVALDRVGNLYVSLPSNHVVRRINLTTGIIQTIAGDGTAGNSGDGGPATRARLDGPWGLAVDSTGNLYIADTAQDVIRKVSTTGVITTEVPKASGLSQPRALAFDPSGVLHIADGYRVVRVGTAAALTVVAGGGGSGGELPRDNVPATSVDLFTPSGLAIDRSRNIYVSEEGWNLVRRVDAANRTIRTFAGTLNVLDGGPALNAPLSFPIGMALDASGNIYIADTEHHRIRRIDAAADPARATIRTVVGTGSPTASPDTTLASAASVDFPLTVSVDARNNVYYTEAGVVRKLDAATGRLTTVAGMVYDTGFSGDNGPANRARLDLPFAAVADSAGNVYISDRENHCIRRVDAATAIIRTVAGVCTQQGFAGDGGPATQSRLNRPMGLAFDPSGNLLIADSGNNVVRRLVVGTGIIQRVAGKGGIYGYSGDGGPPLEAELASPIGLAVDRAGAIYIADEDNDVVRVIRGNTISTFAGVGITGFAGDGGPATFAALNTPTGVALDAAGNVYIVDSDNNRIRRVSAGTVAAPALAVDPVSLNFTVPQGGAPPAPLSLFIRNAGSGPLLWRAQATTSSGGDWLRLSDNAGSTPASLQVTINPTGLAAGTYQGTITITSAEASNSPVRVSVSLTVNPPRGSILALSTQFMSFDAVQGGAPPPAQLLSLSNNGSGDLNFGVQFITSRGGGWLSVSPPEGTVSAGGPAGTVVVSANSEGLATGLYLGLVTVANITAGASTPVAVSLVVGAPATRILLNQTSFVFTVAQGSTLVPSQAFNVINIGQGAMSWQIQSFLPQGTWLRMTPQSGTSDAANIRGSPIVNVAVDASDLRPGVYGALLIVSAPGARNNPELATVILRVLPQGTPPLPLVQPSGLLYTTGTGSAPIVQEVRVQSTGGGTLNFTAGARTQDGGGWLTVSPTSGSITSSADRARVRVQVAPGALAAGVYQGAVTFSFGDGSVREVAVAAILRAATAAAASGVEKQAQQCAPNRQVLVSTQLANNFSLPTGWPVPMAVRVSNDCGDSVTNSTVAASFSNGDPPIVFQNLRDGQYAATWVPAQAPSAGAPVVVSMRSLHPQLREVTVQLTGSLGLDTTNPVISDNGIVNAASFVGFRPLSPGGIFSLFGSNLAGAPTENTAFPLPTTLGGVSVKIGGFDAPLFFAGPNQINGQIPVELANVSSAAVVVTARGIVSAQRTIQLDPTQPGIFVIGQTQGAVLNQDFSINSASNPAARGSVIQIFATGLGPTNPPVPTGARAPATAPFAELTNAVTVAIGGMNAPVRFQALAPTFVGLYQINAEIPMEVTPGDAVRLKITQNGVESNEATIVIR